MLVLERRQDDSIMIGDDVEVFIVKARHGFCKVGIKAPESVKILRSELIESNACEICGEPGQPSCGSVLCGSCRALGGCE